MRPGLWVGIAATGLLLVSGCYTMVATRPPASPPSAAINDPTAEQPPADSTDARESEGSAPPRNESREDDDRGAAEPRTPVLTFPYVVATQRIGDDLDCTCELWTPDVARGEEMLVQFRFQEWGIREHQLRCYGDPPVGWEIRDVFGQLMNTSIGRYKGPTVWDPILFVPALLPEGELRFTIPASDAHGGDLNTGQYSVRLWLACEPKATFDFQVTVF
ncbi:MAG: hypothetical protein IT349_08190 [Candidatus Eisenbacteria bacterium]|nr:hypothetical protein [Candidatus Eisenbacteria bacterium]